MTLAAVSILALSWPFSTAAAGASRTPTAPRRHLRTAQAWWCTARMHNSAVSESFTGPNGPRGCRTLRGHAPPSRNLCRGTAWQRALRADIVAPRSTLILAHAHKRALHAHGAWCGEARAGCRTEQGHAPHGRILHRGTAWQRALPAKTGTQPSTEPHTRTHNLHVPARSA